jgi:hypothetical protein
MHLHVRPVKHASHDEYRRCLVVKEDPEANPDDRRIAHHTIREYETRMRTRPRHQQLW